MDLLSGKIINFSSPENLEFMTFNNKSNTDNGFGMTFNNKINSTISTKKDSEHQKLIEKERMTFISKVENL